MTKKIIAASSLGVSNTKISHDALFVIEQLQKNNYDGYIVGGGIRDILLGKTPKDFDVVTNAKPEAVRKIFRRNSVIIGRRFKIVHVLFDNINPVFFFNNRPIIERHIIEISTYRSSKVHKHNLNEHGKIVEDNNYGTQEEDAFRRDFTINSLFYDPIKEIIIDYTHGIEDVKNKTLRIIGDPKERYTEDPVRILRAIRLAVKLGLQIEKKSAAPFAKFKQLLCNENKWRMYEEMLKICLSGESLKCINALREIRLPYKVFPLFDKLFFKHEADAFALKILEKTDNRLKETNDVSIIFIFSGLLWSMVEEDYSNNYKNGMTKYNALIASIEQHAAFINLLGVTKNIFYAVKDVWTLQIKLEIPQPKNVAKTVLDSRFRQAWHLYTMRHEFQQVDTNIFTWWNKYLQENSNKQILLEELESLIGNQLALMQYKKRKKKKKQS
ncbi:MAG: RNA-poly(A) polymerase [Pseudomonadota bacterium]